MVVIYIVTLIPNELLSRKLILIAKLGYSFVIYLLYTTKDLVRTFLSTESLICLMVEFNISHTTHG